MPAALTAPRLLLHTAGAVRFHLLRGTAAGLLWQGTSALAPFVVGRAIDRGVVAGNTRAMLLWTGLLLAMGVVEAGAARVRHTHAASSNARASAHLRQRLLIRAQALDAAFHDRLPAGALLTRATSDVEHIGKAFDSVPHTVAFAFTVVVVTGSLVAVDPSLALVVVVTLSPLALVMWRSAQPQRRRARRLQEAIERAVTDTADIVGAFEVVRGFGAGRGRRDVLAQDAAAVRARGLAVHRLAAAVDPVLGLVPALALAATLAVGGHLALSGATSVGELVSVLGYVALLVTPVRVLGERVVTLQRALASAQRLVDVLAAEPVVAEASEARAFPAERRPPAVRVQDVGFSRGGRQVLADVTLQVRPGERVAVVGPPGSGKSTLLRLVARQYDPDRGQVLLDGRDLRDLRLRDLRRGVVLVDDPAVLFDGSVSDNVSFGVPDAGQREVMAATEAAAAHAFVDRLPERYGTGVGQSGGDLSGGQRQRLALARALLAPSQVLLLDDVTSALDPATEAEVVAALASATAGRTVLAVTSRPAVIAAADRVVVLRDGRVVADGSHVELVATSPEYADLHAEGTPAGTA